MSRQRGRLDLYLVQNGEKDHPPLPPHCHMPRKARVVAPGVPHHITQRGVGRQAVFFTKRDHQVYLRLLADQSRLAHLRDFAYCLISNHIHLVIGPTEANSLALCLQRVHGRHAQYLNARRRLSGHLWPNRFCSCPLDRQHLWTALCYVEQKPVRAWPVSEPAAWRWSSATAHLGGRDEWRSLNLASGARMAEPLSGANFLSSQQIAKNCTASAAPPASAGPEATKPLPPHCSTKLQSHSASGSDDFLK